MFKRYLWKLCWLAFALVKRGESMKKIYLVVIVLFFISTKVYTLLHNNIFFCRNSPECDLSHVLPDYREQISGTPLKYTLINTAPLAQVVVRHYELLSQHWSPDDMVTPAQWRHNVDIYIPETAKEHHALVVVNNGINYDFWMGWIRLIHFTTAYIFTVALLFRIYWACVGNEYAREMFLVPFWRRAWRKGVISEIRWYFFLEKEAHRYYGHNPVAGLAVMFYFWMSVLMVCSGFALYGEGLGTDSWAYQWFGWMIRLTGNDSLALHFWHRLGMWFIIAFVIAHVYTAIREDIMSRQSVISVMISGWRWFR